MPEPFRMVDVPGKYVITYFGTGMAADYKSFTDRDEAVAEFERMCRDPWKGATRLEFRQEIAVRVYA